MLSAEYIQEQNEKKAREAAEKNKRPYVYFRAEEVWEGRGFPFPHLGDYRPDDWELVDTHFVDSSGLGAEDEPALTAQQFASLVESRIRASDDVIGWAVIEAGQFQVYVGEFHKAADRKEVTA